MHIDHTTQTIYINNIPKLTEEQEGFLCAHEITLIERMDLLDFTQHHIDTYLKGIKWLDKHTNP